MSNNKSCKNVANYKKNWPLASTNTDSLAELHMRIVLISTVYVSPGCTPYSVTLVLLTVIGD